MHPASMFLNSGANADEMSLEPDKIRVTLCNVTRCYIM